MTTASFRGDQIAFRPGERCTADMDTGAGKAGRRISHISDGPRRTVHESIVFPHLDADQSTTDYELFTSAVKKGGDSRS